MAELRIKGTGTLKLFESDNTSSVTIASPASLSANKTITLPDADVTLASGTMLATDGSGASLTSLNASELGSGTVPTARLGTGTASSSTFLAGDNTWGAAGGGKILQVIARSTSTSSNNNSTTPAATDNYATITPSATSSHVIVTMNWRQQAYQNGGNGVNWGWQVFRDIGGAGYSDVYPAAETEMMGLTGFSQTESNDYKWPCCCFMDSPSTTSAVTYKLYIYRRGSVTTTYFGAAGGGDRTTLLEVDGS
jgi:hypothetical protein